MRTPRVTSPQRRGRGPGRRALRSRHQFPHRRAAGPGPDPGDVADHPAGQRHQPHRALPALQCGRHGRYADQSLRPAGQRRHDRALRQQPHRPWRGAHFGRGRSHHHACRSCAACSGASPSAWCISTPMPTPWIPCSAARSTTPRPSAGWWRKGSSIPSARSRSDCAARASATTTSNTAMTSACASSPWTISRRWAARR